ncbi:hypothetical protein SARC_04656 [Sphaeroforma arctica JP610]|uniref:GATA-type domain-containing protein n=1 Tax=Sphaeroforma arctica JP610 TaxID=667725 RepID=A0A0L0G2M2_9EUKA|nr:hypothetical protein SARC_04656 [Sphaeroforma arctica JP610]KNC83079.1 hypothetical protein SARC_04656 [Sphaeroforma arctica JP610]|eukprot:XP_014156981.1 hypothetical protein SARC_04656 [Sphaeroforma arctica JP610]
MASPKTQHAAGLRPPVDPNEFEHAPVRSTLTNDFAQASLGPQRYNAKRNNNIAPAGGAPYGYGHVNAGPVQVFRQGYVNNQGTQQSSEAMVPQDEEKGGSEVSVCANCKGTSTTQWRRGNEGQVLCNACGIYERKNGTMRPLKLCDRRTFTRVKHKNGKKMTSQGDDAKGKSGGKQGKKKNDSQKKGQSQDAPQTKQKSSGTTKDPVRRSASGLESARVESIESGVKGQDQERPADTFRTAGPPERTIQRGVSGDVGGHASVTMQENSGYGCVSCPRPLTIADLNARRQQCHKCVSMGVYPVPGPDGPPPQYDGPRGPQPGYSGAYNGGTEAYTQGQPQFRPSTDMPTQQRDPRYQGTGSQGYNHSNPPDDTGAGYYQETNVRSAPPPRSMSSIPYRMPGQGRASRTQSDSLYPVAAKVRHPFATTHSQSNRDPEEQPHAPPQQVQGYARHGRGDPEFGYNEPQDRQEFFGAAGRQYSGDRSYGQPFPPGEARQDGDVGEHGPAWGSTQQGVYGSGANKFRYDENEGERERMVMQRTSSGPVRPYGGVGGPEQVLMAQNSMGHEGDEGERVYPERGYYSHQAIRKTGVYDPGSSAGGPTRRTTSSSHLRSPYGSNNSSTIVGSGTGKVLARLNQQLESSPGMGVQSSYEGREDIRDSRHNSGDVGPEREGEAGMKATPKIWGPYLNDDTVKEHTASEKYMANHQETNASPKSHRSYVGLHPHSPQDRATRSVSWQQQSSVRGASGHYSGVRSTLARHYTQQRHMDQAEAHGSIDERMSGGDGDPGQSQVNAHPSAPTHRTHTPAAFHPWHTEETLQRSEPKQQYVSSTSIAETREGHTQNAPAMESESMGEDDRGGRHVRTMTMPNTAADTDMGMDKRNASLSPHPQMRPSRHASPELSRVQRSFSDNYRVRSALDVGRDAPSSGSAVNGPRKFLVPPRMSANGVGGTRGSEATSMVAQGVQDVPKDVAGAHAMIDQHMSMGNYLDAPRASKMDHRGPAGSGRESAGGFGPTRRLHTYSSPRLMTKPSSNTTSPKISPIYARESGDVYMAEMRAPAAPMDSEEMRHHSSTSSSGSVDNRAYPYAHGSQAVGQISAYSHAPALGPGHASAKQSMSKLSGTSGQRQCTMCGATETAQWRSGADKEILCNSCGLRQNHFQNREEKNERRRKRYWANQEAKKTKGVQAQGNGNEQAGHQSKQQKEGMSQQPPAQHNQRAQQPRVTDHPQDDDGDTMMNSNEVYT